MKRTLISAIAILLLFTGLTACSTTQPASTTGGDAMKGDAMKDKNGDAMKGDAMKKNGAK